MAGARLAQVRWDRGLCRDLASSWIRRSMRCAASSGMCVRLAVDGGDAASWGVGL